MDKYRYMSITDIYLRHHEALDSAGLSPKYVTMLQEVLGEEQWKEELQRGETAKRQTKE
jgi:hypothetical protein